MGQSVVGAAEALPAAM